MNLQIVDVSQADLPDMLAMNQAARSDIASQTLPRMRRLLDIASYFRMAVYDGKKAGFLIALLQDADYQQPGFKWFHENFDAFLYIDRVVVDSRFRGHGIGKVFYADVQSYAESLAPCLACEIPLQAGNEISLLFHGTLGFHEVGQMPAGRGRKHVSLLAKQLPCFEFVCEQRELGRLA